MERIGNGDKTQKGIEVFHCKLCDYKASNRGHLNRHFKTKKHKERIGNKKRDEGIRLKNHKCQYCERGFKSASGRWKHENKCSKNQEWKYLKIIEEQKKKIEELKYKEMDHLKKALLEKDKEIKRLIENGPQITNNNCTQINNNINIQLFLNEHCKNAMPIMDFIKGLTFKLTDIDPERPLTTIESLSNAISEQLGALKDTERPIHCSDVKRLKFYIKDASNGWIKDEDNKKIDKAIGFANMRHQGAWHSKANEEGIDSIEFKKDADYHKMNVAMAKFSDDPIYAKNKVKRAIASTVNIKNTIPKI